MAHTSATISFCCIKWKYLNFPKKYKKNNSHHNFNLNYFSRAVFTTYFHRSEEKLLPKLVLYFSSPQPHLHLLLSRSTAVAVSTVCRVCSQLTTIAMPAETAENCDGNHCLCFPWIPTKGWWIWYTSFMKILSAFAILCCCTTHTQKNTRVLALPILFPRNLIRTCVSQRQHTWTQVPTALSALTVGAAWPRRSKIRSLTGMQKALMHRGLAHDEINHRNRSNCDRDKQTKGEKRTCCQETGTEGHSNGRCSTGRTQLLSFGFVM